MKENQKKIYLLITLFISLICLFTGISVAIFNYFGAGTTNNVIQTGKIIFSYSDANGGTNGINIEDAVPISDEAGKVLSGDKQFFNFNVSATSTNSNLTYEIAVEKEEESTLSDDLVKIYLTTFEGMNEVETPLTIADDRVLTYSELIDTTNPLLSGKTVYYGNVKAGEVSYGRKFCLRMWIKDITNEDYEYSIINDKTFKLKVNVAASNIY